MKRELILALSGAMLLAPAGAEAQRNRSRDADRDRVERVQPVRTGAERGRVERLEPVRVPGRIAPRRPVARSTRDYRSRVVYTSGRPQRNVRGGTVWVRANWGRVSIKPFAFRNQRRELNRSDLRNILGRRTVDRIQDAGRSVGLRGALRGHWVRGGQGRVLVVTMGRVDVAEVADFNRDGFVDQVFLLRDARRSGRLVYGR